MHLIRHGWGKQECSYGLSGPTDNPFAHIRSTHAGKHVTGDTVNAAKGNVLHHIGFHMANSSRYEPENYRLCVYDSPYCRCCCIVIQHNRHAI